MPTAPRSPTGRIALLAGAFVLLAAAAPVFAQGRIGPIDSGSSSSYFLALPIPAAGSSSSYFLARPLTSQAFCCIPEVGGSICVQGGFANEDECVYNRMNPDTSTFPDPHGEPGIIGYPPSEPVADQTFYPGVAFDTSKEQCNFFCGLRHQYFYCINRGRSAYASSGAASSAAPAICLQPGAAGVTEELMRVERGHLLESTCLEACPPNSCESCQILDDYMQRNLSPTDDAGRTQFCEQASEFCQVIREDDVLRCRQKPKCKLEYYGCCDARTFEYWLTSNDPEQTGTPEDVQRMLDRNLENGEPNTEYVPNLRWLPGEEGQNTVNYCLEGRGQTVADATLPSITYAAGEAEQCKPRYYACCDTIEPHFFIAEESNAPITPSIQSILNAYSYASYVRYWGALAAVGDNEGTDDDDDDEEEDEDDEDEDQEEPDFMGDDYFNYIDGCMMWPGTDTNYWRQDPPGQLTAVDLDALAQMAEVCPAQYYGGSSSARSQPPPTGCAACDSCNGTSPCTEAACRANSLCYPITYHLGESRTPFTRCFMRREYCTNLPPTCTTCPSLFSQSTCENAGGWCSWVTDAAGPHCVAAPRCFNQSSSARPGRQYNACDRRVNRNPDGGQNCWRYNPDAATVQNPFGVDFTKLQLLKAHTITYDSTDPGLALCSTVCEDIERYEYCCHKPSGELLFENRSVCVRNRDVTFPVRDDGSPPGTAVADCRNLHEFYQSRLNPVVNPATL